jgi:hypothetical protein
MGALPLLLIVGCSGGGRKHDLDSLMGKVSTGMTELQVTQAIGAPSHVDIVDGGRDLRYDGEGGGYILVTLRGDRVTDAVRH